MTMVGVGVRLLLGVLLGHLLPRLPMLILCRTKGFNLRFAPHPAPPRLGPHLTARVSSAPSCLSPLVVPAAP